MDEVPKRLTPDPDTIRYLAAHSGNLCAFYGCDHAVVSADNRLIVQLCHVQAAMPGGERFNPDMTNEERRHRDNLMFLCLRHHIETNNVEAWPVDRMREMKEQHEARHRDGTFRLPDVAIRDITKAFEPGRPQTLARFGGHLNAEVSKPEYAITPEQFQEDIEKLIGPLIDRVRKLSPDTRALLAIMIGRSEPHRDDLGAPAEEIEQITGMTPDEIKPHFNTMERYGLVFMDEDWDNRWWICTRDLDGWAFWRDVKAYCEANGIDIGALINDLRFHLLD